MRPSLAVFVSVGAAPKAAMEMWSTKPQQAARQTRAAAIHADTAAGTRSFGGRKRMTTSMLMCFPLDVARLAPSMASQMVQRVPTARSPPTSATSDASWYQPTSSAV